MMRAPRFAALGLAATLAGAGAGGCWYHRVDVGTPVTVAQKTSSTEWSFLWHAKRIAPDDMCMSRGLQSVVVRSNMAFSLLSVVTLGLVSVARVERHCARAQIVDPGSPPDTAPTGPPAGATYLSIAWGAYQKEPAPECSGRPIARVEVKANPLFDLVASIGGIFAPTRIRWSCVPRPGGTP